MRDFLSEIPLTSNNVRSISILCDNQATLARAYSDDNNGKSRYMSLRHDYVKKLIKKGIISLIFVKSNKNLADLFTIPLSEPLIRDLVN